MKHLQVGVIGLGKFGFAFGKALTELGQEVLGLDRDTENVRRAQHVFTQVYQGDAMDKKVLSQLGFPELTHVLVSVGHSIEASTMISLYLKELGTANVWVKAVSADHVKLLWRIGVDDVVFPEEFAAIQLAHRLAVPGLISYLPFDQDVAIQELAVDKWQGQSLRALELPTRHQVQVIAVKKTAEPRYRFIPRADEPLGKGDLLVVIGHSEDLESLKP
jgi:trk system potassium uptake protein TrkA